MGDQSDVASPSFPQEGDDRILISRQKLEQVADSLRPWINQDDCLHLQLCQSVEDTLNYRCRCTFQFIHHADGSMQYAVRLQKEPIPIDSFPVATLRIQKAMSDFLKFLNEYNDNDANNCNSQTSKGQNMRNAIAQNLTCITFSSSWTDFTPDSFDCCKEGFVFPTSDCIVTLHYDNAISDVQCWKQQAQIACKNLNLTQITGRSRKRILRAVDDNSDGDPILRDTIWIVPQVDPSNQMSCWKVVVVNESVDIETVEVLDDAISVNYEKSESAFFHPNGKVMRHALEWMLNCVSKIVNDRKITNVDPSSANVASNNEDDNNNLVPHKLNLLELYCGCGAHTVALARSEMIERIVAIELDERLVQACQRNCEINDLSVALSNTKRNKFNQGCASSEARARNEAESLIQLVSVDAGKWARDNNINKSKNVNTRFDVLLVDPPRQGLSKEVCDMAINNYFEHILYISCGRDALVRDLEFLVACYEVVSCTLLDLFPGTTSVESLVHLKRIKR